MEVIWGDQNGKHLRWFFCNSEEDEDAMSLFCLKVNGIVREVLEPNW